MNRKDDLAKIQHYVPQFLLRNFSVPLNKSQIFVFDKHEDKSFKTNIKNVASEAGFYNIQIDKTLYTFEPSLGDLESAASTIVNKIIREEILPAPASGERLLLATFIAAQFLRVRSLRKQIADLNVGLAETLQTMGLDPSEIKGFTVMDEDAVKGLSMNMLGDLDDFIPYFFDKTWILLKTPKDQTLFISDNPVTLQNKNDFGLYGNSGIGVKGIEVYFPISRHLSLGIICRSYDETFTNSYEKYKELKRTRPDVIEKLGVTLMWFEQFFTGMNTGCAITTRLMLIRLFQQTPTSCVYP